MLGGLVGPRASALAFAHNVETLLLMGESVPPTLPAYFMDISHSTHAVALHLYRKNRAAYTAPQRRLGLQLFK
jgi:hypothetical protein